MLRCQSRQKHYAESVGKSFDFYCYNNNVCDMDDDADDGDNDYVNYYHSKKTMLMRMMMTKVVMVIQLYPQVLM